MGLKARFRDPHAASGGLDPAGIRSRWSTATKTRAVMRTSIFRRLTVMFISCSSAAGGRHETLKP